MDDVLRYEGTRALVTGAASGMGAATASILAELGAEVHGLDIQDGDGSLDNLHRCDLGDPEAIESRAVYRAVTGPKPPPRRITLGYPALAAAREVWVLASGEGKAEALRASLAKGGNTPLACVLQSREHTEILTDFKP